MEQNNQDNDEIEEQLLQNILQESLQYSLINDNNIIDNFNNDKKINNLEKELKIKQDEEYKLALKKDLEKINKEIFEELSPNSLRKERLKFFNNNYHSN